MTLTVFNLTAETALAIAALLSVASVLTPRSRVLLYRCGFIFALLAPLTVLNTERQTAWISVAQQDLTALALDFEGDTTAIATHVVSLPWVLAFVWLAGVTFVLGRSLLSHLMLSRAFASALPLSLAQEASMRVLAADLGVSAPVRARFSSLAPAPCTFGWLRPKVLIPTDTPQVALETILAHELCHVRGHDALWLTISRFACAIYWFNPLMWMAADRHEGDIELVCDDAATTGGVGVDDYIAALMQAARNLMRPTTKAAVMMSQRGLNARVRALIRRTAPLPRPSIAVKLAVFACMAAAIMALSTGELVAAEPRATPRAGNGLIYVEAPNNVRVNVGSTGACWDGARCVFEHPLGAEIALSASADRATGFDWSGCTQSGEDATCRVRIGQTPARVSVRLRR